MPEMKLAGDRYKYPVSDGELERRLTAVQQAMREKGLDCCIAQTQSTIFDSITRYLTDTVTHAYGTTLIIPAEGKITMINHGVEEDDAPVPASLRNVKKLYKKSYCQPFGCTDGITGNLVAEELNAGGFKRIGLIMKQLMSADTLDIVREKVAGCEIVDFTKEFSYIKAVKSPEEWKLIDKALEAHRQLMDMVPVMIRPGRMEYEMLADIEQASRYIGCDWIGNVAVGAAPNGKGTPFQQNFGANRRIEEGDGVTVMIEVSGPGGIYCELARTFCLGEPDADLVYAYEVAKGGQELVAASAKPGVTCKELTELYIKYIADKGITDQRVRFVGHSQGYDMMEAPVICLREDMELREDMFLCIHPEIFYKDQFAICCDNYRITQNGGVRVTQAPQGIFTLKY